MNYLLNHAVLYMKWYVLQMSEKCHLSYTEFGKKKKRKRKEMINANWEKRSEKYEKHRTHSIR